MHFLKKTLLSLCFVAGSFQVHADASHDFADFKQRFNQKAAQAGISAATRQAFLQTAQPYQPAVKSDQSQAEFKKQLWDYLNATVSNSRIQEGKRLAKNHAHLLQAINKQTGVLPEVVLAIWGMESNFGSYTGKVPVVSALATLANQGRRQAFFEGELLALLKLIDNQDVPSINVQGSWAGGLGHTQFIPTTYSRYAVDFNRDGHRNLWQIPDALASTAHYLQAMGWQSGFTWGREVRLPADFNYLLANDKSMHPLSFWQAKGVRNLDGSALPNADIDARLFVPAGANGPQFLLYKNFDVIKRYNNADAYALAVLTLADKIRGKPGIITPWPTDAKRVTQNDIKIVQTALNAKGYDAGSVDGVWGQKTTRALQQFQHDNGLIADGFLTVSLYRQLITGIY